MIVGDAHHQASLSPNQCFHDIPISDRDAPSRPQWRPKPIGRAVAAYSL
jgi:hypothetical protein